MKAAQISAPFRRHSSKVNKADFSARLPKLNLAGPDGIPQIGGKVDNKSI